MLSTWVDGIEYRFFNYLYAVSRCGKVIKKHLPYPPSKRKDGYLSIGHGLLLHRVVAQCWLSTFDPKKQVHHINNDKTDNCVENLECLSQKEHLTERHAEQLRNNGKYTRTAETIEKLRQSRLGRVTSEETKAKQRASLLGRKRPFFHRASHSQESRENRSLSHVRNTACLVLGVEYRSFSEAARATGMNKLTIRKRCLSGNFPDFKILTSAIGAALPT